MDVLGDTFFIVCTLQTSSSTVLVFPSNVFRKISLVQLQRVYKISYVLFVHRTKVLRNVHVIARTCLQVADLKRHQLAPGRRVGLEFGGRGA